MGFIIREIGYMVLCVCTLQQAESSPILTVHPTYVDVTNNTDVLVTCTFDKRGPETTYVYSILISGRGTTLAVCFKHAPCRAMDAKVSVENSSVSTLTFLNVRVRNVTCDDRGDYSCKMAVRQRYRNVQLVSNVAHLNVTGQASSVNFNPPKAISINKTHTQLQLCCSTLQRGFLSGWVWTVNNHTSIDDSDTCVYSEMDCLNRCSSELTLDVPLDQETLGVSCFIAGMSAISVLNISRLLREHYKGMRAMGVSRLLEDQEEDSEDLKKNSVKMAYSITSEEKHSTFYVLHLAVIVGVLTALAVLIAAVRLSRKVNTCKWVYVKTKKYVKRNDQPQDVKDTSTYSNLPLLDNTS